MDDFIIPNLASACGESHHPPELSAWYGHIPFAFWIVNLLKPKIFVELGTQNGISYSAFCDAITKNKIDTTAYAVDTWEGDPHAGFYGEKIYLKFKEYHDQHYHEFSTLLRMTFDEAVHQFSNQSIDLLHIDGLHTYEAVKHDFEAWLPKLSDKAVVLFHDTCVRENNFGVYQLWEELTKEYPGFNFTHAHGLGVLLVGQERDFFLKKIADLEKENFHESSFNQLFQKLGDNHELRYSLYKQQLDFVEQKKNIEEKQELIEKQASIIQKKENLVAEGENLLNQKNNLILEQERLIQQQKEVNAEKEGQLQDLLAVIHEKNQDLQKKDQQLAEKDMLIEQKNASIIKKASRFIKASGLYGIIKNKKNFFYHITLPTRRNNRKKESKTLQHHYKTNQSKIHSTLTKENSNQLNILFINHSTPTPDLDGGSIDIYKNMIALKEMGHTIVFMPADLKYQEGYSEDLLRHGIVCLCRENIKSIEEYIQLEGNQFDIIFIYRIHVAEYFFQLIKNFKLKAKVIFCPVDLHYLRQSREEQVTRIRKYIGHSKQTKLREIDLMKKVDLSIVLSEKEEHLIRQDAPLANVITIPFIRDIPGRKNSFEVRNGLLFIGGFDHRPNVDAVVYFTEKIWPLILRKNPNITLTVIGSNAPTKILSLNGKNGIIIKGYVHNLEEDFERAKLSIVPLRFGAGIKGKIATSLSFGVPCISTEIGVEGMKLTNGVNILVAQSEHDFAEKVISLYSDEDTWNKMSENSLKYATEMYSMDTGKKNLEKIITLLKSNPLKLKDPLQQEIKNKKTEKLSMFIELCSFDKGGLQQVVLDSAIEFKNRGHYPIIITSGVIGYLGEKAQQAGIKVVKISSTNPTELQQLIDQYNPDVSFSHFSSDGYPVYQKNKIPNITFIHNVYAILSSSQRKEFIANDKYVDKYISVSDKATEYAISNLGISSDKVITVPNGLKIEEHSDGSYGILDHTREGFNLYDDDYVFINPASYNLHKGHYLLASALKKVISKHPEVKVLCVGNEVYLPHVKQLRQYLKEQQLENNFLMPGYFSNIKDIFKLSDAFILPSFIEGWSIAMNEAMYYGKPMICTDTGGASAVIEKNDIGILIPNEYGDSKLLLCNQLNDLAYSPRDYKTTEILAQAMCNFVENKKQWAEKGLLGRNKIIQYYNYDVVIKKYLIVVEQLLSRNKSIK